MKGGVGTISLSRIELISRLSFNKRKPTFCFFVVGADHYHVILLPISRGLEDHLKHFTLTIVLVVVLPSRQGCRPQTALLASFYYPIPQSLPETLSLFNQISLPP